MLYTDILHSFFGFSVFRDGQLESIRCIAEEGRDVLAVLPTSTGKTLIYQLLTIIQRQQDRSSITLVVSPLVALMADQISSWNRKFILDECGLIQTRGSSSAVSPVAIALGSAQTGQENLEMRACTGEFPVVYVAPEKLPFMPVDFLRLVKLLVVDECHCISEHGNSFRPAYRNIRTFFRGVQTLAVTATAPSAVSEDIINNLEIPDAKTIRTGIYRPNLRLLVRHKGVSRSNDIDYIMNQCSEHPNGRSVVFATTRKECDTLAAALGNGALSYHAGLPTNERERIMAKFTTGSVIVSTNCFGLGVDLPDIRLVIHYGLPRSLLGYVQECGRAGRDGERSTCILLYSSTDVVKYNDTERDLSMAKEMLGWIRTDHLCRHHTLSKHFGDSSSHAQRPCTWGGSDLFGCDVCMPSTDGPVLHADVHAKDITLLLCAIAQTGDYAGKRMPIDFLLGSKNKKLKRFVHCPTSVFGKGRYLTRTKWVAVHYQACHKKFIHEILTHRGYTVYKLTNSGKSMIRS
jgi:ATP-dependent DNA helicase RecQ